MTTAPEQQPPLRVLQLLGPSTGGIRRHVAEVVRRTEELGWHHVVAGPDGVMAGVGPQHLSIGAADDWRGVGLRVVRRRLRRHLRTVDLVHAHGLTAAAVVATIGRRAPMVVTLHNDVAGTHAGASAAIGGPVQRLLLRRADHVILVSPTDAAANAAAVDPDRCTVMMSFSARPEPRADRSSTRARLGVDVVAPLVAVVARLHPQKDLGTFLRAFARVRSAEAGVRAVVVGDGPEREALVALRDSLGLTDAVRFLGASDEVADVVSASDVVVISSRWEAGPIVAVEAMQLGVPVVMTDTGAVARAARARDAARVVPVGDTEALGEALLAMVRDPAGRADMAARASTLVEAEFDAAVLSRRLDAVYRRVLGLDTSARRPVAPG